MGEPQGQTEGLTWRARNELRARTGGIFHAPEGNALLTRLLATNSSLSSLPPTSNKQRSPSPLLATSKKRKHPPGHSGNSSRAGPSDSSDVAIKTRGEARSTISKHSENGDTLQSFTKPHETSAKDNHTSPTKKRQSIKGLPASKRSKSESSNRPIKRGHGAAQQTNQVSCEGPALCAGKAKNVKGKQKVVPGLGDNPQPQPSDISSNTTIQKRPHSLASRKPTKAVNRPRRTSFVMAMESDGEPDPIDLFAPQFRSPKKR